MGERAEYNLLGMNVFTFDEALPSDEDTTYTNIDSVLDVFKDYKGKDVSITEEQVITIYDGADILNHFRLEEDESFRNAMIQHLSMIE
ncbi:MULTISPECIES: hypothetical protein [unclassified Exiguobacterium]|uniref:hypothetical protein n=1 Tax=unclassified Exiguobacterium TaxID=2644629 RepID=UPI001BEB1A93|nr:MULTISPECIES: hypothetical protein [unclassified Exiguobacterium]